MKKLFIDTCAFEKKKLNFEQNNPIVKMLIHNYLKKEYEYCNLSVIDGEIRQHLEKRCKRNYDRTLEINWLQKYIDKDEIKNNCYHDMELYEKFLENIGAISCDIGLVDSEEIMKNYFNCKFPFESKKNKKNEFPDAYISAYLNNFAERGNEIYFVSNDAGLMSSLSKNIHKYNDINDLLVELNGVSPKVFCGVEEYISLNIETIEQKLLEKLSTSTFGMEYEEIDLDKIKIIEQTGLDIFEDNEGNFIVSFESCLEFIGSFVCLDYSNSYMPNDCDFYVVEEYLNAKIIQKENIEVSFTLSKVNEEFILKEVSDLNVNFYYDDIEEGMVLEAEECLEGSFDQDRFPR